MKFSPRILVDAYLKKITGRRVIRGPFKGLLYVKESIDSVLYPKLIGTYEKELHGILETYEGNEFEKVLVIGAGEGYYAVGLAKKWNRPVLAFERDDKGRQLITRLSLINRKTVFVKGMFEPGLDTQSGRDFILMDIEGEEKEVLTAEQFLEWQYSTIITEVHSSPVKGLLKERAAYTHHSTFIPTQERTLRDYPFSPPFSKLLKRWWWAAIQEWRSDSVGWLIFEPKR